MNSIPPATIIITSYNYARYVAQSVDSALNQTYSNTEVIVVDDGSEDESPEILRNYGNRIRLLLKANGGQGSAFNAGFPLSKGEIVVFLDSDDVLLPTAIEEAVKALGNGEASMVHWQSRVINIDGKEKGLVRPKAPLAEGDLRDRLVRKGPSSFVWASTSSCAWSRRFLEHVLPMPERDYWTFCDSYLATLAPLFGSIKRLSTPQTLYRSHGRGIHNQVNIEQTLDVCERDCKVLRDQLEKLGIEAEPNRWGLDFWWRKTRLALGDIDASIPKKETLILIDDDTWGCRGTVKGRRSLPFLEKHGLYNGAPPDSMTAIVELERLRRDGAEFVVFAWQAFWWLEHYREFREYLESRYRCSVANERALIFDLRAPTLEVSD